MIGISISKQKGRFGNNIYHLINLLLDDGLRLLVIDHSYRKIIKKIGLKKGKIVFVFIPNLDQLASVLFRLNYYRKKKLSNPQDGAFERIGAHSKTIMGFKIRVYIGELLSDHFDPSKFHKLARLFPAEGGMLQPSLNPYAWHVRVGDFRIWRTGEFIYTEEEAGDVVRYLATMGHDIFSTERHFLYSDDREGAEELLGRRIKWCSADVTRKDFDDWSEIKRSKVIICNASTFAMSAFLLGSRCRIFVVPKRIYDIFLRAHDPLYCWLQCVDTYRSLTILRKPETQ